MKWLRGFNSFKEDVDVNKISIDDSDAVDVKASKTSMNDLKSQVDEFKAKKSQIDSLFKSDMEKSKLDDEVAKVIGNSDEDHNPFLANYIQVANDKKRLENLMDSVTSDNKSLQENKSLLSMSDSNDQKTSLQETINIISKRISDSKISIEVLKRSIIENQKKIDDKMVSMEKEILGNINSIEDTRK